MLALFAGGIDSQRHAIAITLARCLHHGAVELMFNATPNCNQPTKIKPLNIAGLSVHMETASFVHSGFVGMNVVNQLCCAPNKSIPTLWRQHKLLSSMS